MIPTKMNLLMLLTFLLQAATTVLSQDACSTGYFKCAIDGASVRDVPSPGPELGFLYLSVVDTVEAQSGSDGPPSSSSGQPHRGQGVSTCCAQSTQCLLMGSFEILFCYDKFTTNFFLSDGSYGTLSNGSYVAADGQKANLISGDYTAQDGTQLNMYDEDPADKPNTAAMSIPTPFTSSGVGSAIPGNELGTVAGTVTSEMSESTTTTSIVSVSSSMSSQSTILSGSNSGPTVSSTTITSRPPYSMPQNHTYGISSDSATGASSSSPGTSGASASSPIIPYINKATTSILMSFASKVLLSIIITFILY